MKVFVITLIFLAMLCVVILVGMSLISSKWHPKGLVKGKLARCTEKPNCVCSEYPEDKKHFVAPIKISDVVIHDVVDIVKGIIQDMGGKVVFEDENYIAATFQSPLFRFTDDLEIRIDLEGKLMHVRSAARVGYSDIGVNKSRVEVFMQKFDKAIKR